MAHKILVTAQGPIPFCSLFLIWLGLGFGLGLGQGNRVKEVETMSHTWSKIPNSGLVPVDYESGFVTMI